MKFYLSTTQDNNNVMNKTITDPIEVTLNLKRDFDIKNPRLVIKEEGFSIQDYNYISVPELERFYFIGSVTNLGSSLYRLDCSTDLLETFKQDILDSQAMYSRGIKAGDYQDGELITTLNKSTTKLYSDKSIGDKASQIMVTMESTDNA